MKKVSAFQTTPGTVLNVNVTLITKEYRVVSVEKKNADSLPRFYKYCPSQDYLQKRRRQNLLRVKTGQNRLNKQKCVFLVDHFLQSHYSFLTQMQVLSDVTA